MTEETITDTIISFGNLKENWDSYGADIISQKTIEKALIYASNLDNGPWYVFPSCDGSIIFEQSYRGFDIEINIKAI